MPSVRPFANGNHLAAISSWLGGTQYDLRLARVLHQYGWKGTFFIDPDQIGKPGMLSADEVRGLRDSGFAVGLLVDSAGNDAGAIQNAVLSLEAVSNGAIESYAAPDTQSHSHVAAESPGLVIGQRFDETEIRASDITDWHSFPVTARALHDHMELRERWEAIEETGDGVFHIWGNAAEYGGDDDIWADLECNLAWFCGHQHVWYCSAEDLYRHLTVP